MGERKAKHILEHVDKSAHRDEASAMRDVLIPRLVAQIDLLKEQLNSIEAEMRKHLDKSSYQLRTMPGIGDVLAATFEAEIGPIDRFDTASQLARCAGVAPAENSSGTRRHVTAQSYGRRRLNRAFYTLAFNQIASTL